MDKQKKFKRIKNFVPSKKMGQNFLTDDSVARSIVDLIDVGEYDLVVEVGPGMGALTQYLIQFKQKVIAIELDKRLVEQLQHKFDKYSNLQVINDDILEIDLCQLVTEYKRVVMVSNLPYSISTPMLFQFFKQNKIQTFYCMLQRELVDRLIAKPGSKNYGSISVVTQSYVTIAKLLNVSPQAFSPAPKVESSVIVMNKLAKNFDEKWAKFVQQCFAYKRKTLINNLKIVYPINHIQALLSQLEVEPTIRSEQLSVDVLFQIYQGLTK